MNNLFIFRWCRPLVSPCYLESVFVCNLQFFSAFKCPQLIFQLIICSPCLSVWRLWLILSFSRQQFRFSPKVASCNWSKSEKKKKMFSHFMNETTAQRDLDRDHIFCPTRPAYCYRPRSRGGFTPAAWVRVNKRSVIVWTKSVGSAPHQLVGAESKSGLVRFANDWFVKAGKQRD